LPFPQEYGRQRGVRLIEASPAGYVISPSFVDTWPSDGSVHRAICFEHVLADVTQPLTFSAVYEYVSHAYYPVLSEAQVRPCVREDLGAYLQERPPHIRFAREIREVVERIVVGEANPLARARRIFHWFEDNHRYAFEEEYSTIRSLCEKAFRERRGDCGIKAMLFITMCRLAGIPARFQSGWATFPAYWSMHDWAEIYVEPWGWLPVDPSYGIKASDDAAVREFYFGHQDAYRMIVNLDYGREFVPPKRDLRSETADFQRGEVEIDGRNLYFDEWDYEFGFDVEPAGGSS
jgi:transglutaminase-like putative cysteine protease